MSDLSLARRRWLGWVLTLCFALASVSTALALYARATHNEVEVIFDYQQGLANEEPNGALIEVDVGCTARHIYLNPNEQFTMPLGWLAKGELVTVQIRGGARNYAYSFHLQVNGHRRAGATEGKPGAQSQARLSEWLVARTFSSEGKPVVEAGCRTTIPSPPVTLIGPLTSSGHTFDWPFSTAVLIEHIMFWLYFGVGIALIFVAFLLPALERWAKRSRANRAVTVFGTVFYAAFTLASYLHVFWLDVLIAVGCATFSIYTAASMLRSDATSLRAGIVHFIRELRRDGVDSPTPPDM